MLLESFKSIIGWVAFAVSQPFFYCDVGGYGLGYDASY